MLLYPGITAKVRLSSKQWSYLSYVHVSYATKRANYTSHTTFIKSQTLVNKDNNCKIIRFFAHDKKPIKVNQILELKAINEMINLQM